MTTPKLSKRLQCAASFVREGAFVADVGTDHAYLPIALCLEGRICGGVVSDIHKGPIDRAAEHIRRWGLERRLTPVHCDGLVALEPYHPEDIFILGMGGELIADILGRAPFVKRSDVRLILQPMTHAETLVLDDRIYQVLCAEYAGIPVPVPAEDSLALLIGKRNLERRDELTVALVAHWRAVLERQASGKRQAGSDATREERLLREIGEWIHDGE